MDKQHQRDFLEIQKTIESRIDYLNTSGFPKQEIEYRQQEHKMMLNKIAKIRSNRLKPLQSLETVRGTQFKIGDKFHIAGDELTAYNIVAFPDSSTIRGECSNPAIGKPWTCEVYVESAFKVKKKKEPKAVRIRTPKIVEVNKGDYFALRTNNTIYKVLKVKKKTIKCKDVNGKEFTLFKESAIRKTKKEFKKQPK